MKRDFFTEGGTNSSSTSIGGIDGEHAMDQGTIYGLCSLKFAFKDDGR
jgi:hypothetical protein